MSLLVQRQKQEDQSNLPLRQDTFGCLVCKKLRYFILGDASRTAISLPVYVFETLVTVGGGASKISRGRGGTRKVFLDGQNLNSTSF